MTQSAISERPLKKILLYTCLPIQFFKKSLLTTTANECIFILLETRNRGVRNSGKVKLDEDPVCHTTVGQTSHFVPQIYLTIEITIPRSWAYVSFVHSGQTDNPCWTDSFVAGIYTRVQMFEEDRVMGSPQISFFWFLIVVTALQFQITAGNLRMRLSVRDLPWEGGSYQ